MNPLILLIFTGISCVVQTYALFDDNSNLTWVATVYCPAQMFVLCILTAVQIVGRESSKILHPITWMLIANAAYFGFGPLAYHFGSVAMVRAIQHQFYVDDQTLIRVNLLNSVFFFTLLAGYLSSINFLSCGLKTVARNFDTKIVENTAIYFAMLAIVFGTIIRFGFVLPYEFGFSNRTLPGVVYTLDGLLTIALAPVVYLAIKRPGLATMIAFLFVAEEVASGLLRFNKTNILATTMSASIGYYLARPNVRSAAMIGIFCSISYVAFAPMIAPLREECCRRYNSHYGASINQRIEIINDLYYSGTLVESGSQEKQSWWSRLNYTPAQAFCLRRYDQGSPINCYENALWAFAPRFLFPDKPNMTSIGIELSEQFDGNRNNSMGIGLAAEAYMFSGWLAVLLVGLAVGLEVAVIENVLIRSSQSFDWLMFPFYALGMKMGTRLDGFLIGDFVGTALQLLCGFSIFLIIRKYFGMVPAEKPGNYDYAHPAQVKNK